MPSGNFWFILKTQLMISFLLEKTKTRDGLTLEGILAKPKSGNKTALLWVHGLTGSFHSGLPRVWELARSCTRNGIAFASFNTRGSAVAEKFRKGKEKILAGGGFEKFESCVYDIAAILNLLKKRGYRRVFLVGHSTGANKSLYYVYKKNDRRIKGLALVGPMSDLVGQKKALGKKFEPVLKEVRKISRIKKRANLCLPQEIFLKKGLPVLIISAQRYLSLYTAGSREDVFPYSNSRAKWKELKSVKIPVLTVVGSKDEYLDRSAGELTKIFRKNAVNSRRFTAAIIKGAGHGFLKKEKDLAEVLVRWILGVK